METTGNVLRTSKFWRGYYDREDSGERAKPPGSASDFRFELPCGPRYSLRVEYALDSWGITLLLVDVASEETHELGWWDESRWHPYALRWDELMLLHRYWESSGDGGVAAERVLLLSPFVGIGMEEREDLAIRRQFLARALQSLGVADSREAQVLGEQALRPPSEDDYSWVSDPRVGWLFSGEYPCYSLRNHEHTGASEPRFPFERFAQLLIDTVA